MLLTQLRMQILNLVLDDLRIAEAWPINGAHPLLNDVWVRWVACLEDGPLLDAEDAIVGVAVWHHEVQDIRWSSFFQSAR